MPAVETHVVTLIADRAATALAPDIIDRVRDAIQGGPPDTLSAGEAVDIACAAPDIGRIRAAIGTAQVDAIAMPRDARRKRLLIADMDSTMIAGESLDELAELAGVGEAVAAITRRSMNGEVDFEGALRERVAMLRGAPVDLLERTWRGVRPNPGARALVATMRAHGAATALVSGGFTWFTRRVAGLLGFDTHRANVLRDDGTHLTGEMDDPILDQDAKLRALHELAASIGIGLEATMAVGDGANDIAMLRAAGLGVAFRAKPVVAARVDAQLRHADLRGLLFAQGYRAAEIVAD